MADIVIHREEALADVRATRRPAIRPISADDAVMAVAYQTVEQTSVVYVGCAVRLRALALENEEARSYDFVSGWPYL